MVSVGTLATFFMISFGTLWRRYHSAKQPLGPVLAAQLAGIVVCSLGEPFHGGNKLELVTASHARVESRTSKRASGAPAAAARTASRVLLGTSSLHLAA